MKDLKTNDDIVVSKADKGNVCVIMDTRHYTDLAWRHLGDDNTYCRLTTDPTPDLVSKFNSYLLRCLQDGVIDKYTLEKLTLDSNNTCTQKIYFLAKIHKHPIKVRPIVSCTDSPTNTASAYLDRLLQPHMRKVRSYIKYSTDVINILANLTFPPHVYLVTSNIESLYTNITHTRAIEAFTSRFRSHPNFVFLLDLLKFVLGSNV